MSEEKQAVKVVFAKSNNYKIYPASGVWVSVTPNGELKLDYYVEYKITPEKIEIDLAESPATERMFPEKPHFIREIQFSVLMSKSAALSFGKILQGVAS